MNTPRLLLIEDDSSTRESLERILTSEGYATDAVAGGPQGLRLADERAYDVVLTDLRLPGMDGLEVVRRLRELRPRLPIVMMTAHGTTDSAIEATKLGVYEYLLKPLDPEELLRRLGEAAMRGRLMTERVDLGDAPPGGSALVGTSRAMQGVYKEIGRLAAATVTVLIRGETGTGKELVARALYQHSGRAHQPFVAVNCAAIPESLIESELFGHEKGAFTGAHARRIGRFEQAHRGTLFLDEIGDLPAQTQVKLLRVLQERCLQRVGSGELIPVDVRVLAATHADLETGLRERTFREDLYYRLSVATLRLPPLRDRREDIPALATFLLRKHALALGEETAALLPEGIALLAEQDWPGNVRQLENVLRQAMLHARPFPVGPDHLRAALAGQPIAAAKQTPFASYVKELLARAQRGDLTDAHAHAVGALESELFSRAIELAQGNQSLAARWLGVSRLCMRETLRSLGVHPSSPASGDDHAGSEPDRK